MAMSDDIRSVRTFLGSLNSETFSPALMALACTNLEALAEEDPVGGKAELRGHLKNPAVRDAPLAACLTHGLRGDPEQFGELAVAPESGTLKQTIESFWRSVIHTFGLDEREKEVNHKLKN